jgi:hypothetical protein
LISLCPHCLLLYSSVYLGFISKLYCSHVLTSQVTLCGTVLQSYLPLQRTDHVNRVYSNDLQCHTCIVITVFVLLERR